MTTPPPQPVKGAGCVLCPRDNRRPVHRYVDAAYGVCAGCCDEFMPVHPGAVGEVASAAP